LEAETSLKSEADIFEVQLGISRNGRHLAILSLSIKPKTVTATYYLESGNTLAKQNCSERTENMIISWLLQMKN